jgi:hypothetical protein
LSGVPNVDQKVCQLVSDVTGCESLSWANFTFKRDRFFLITTGILKGDRFFSGQV